MSDSEFENYVALIAKLLQLKRDERELISGELQDHLQMRVADLTSDGTSKQDAIAQALEEFGDAAVMAKNFQTVLNLKRRRWMMRFATFSIAGVFTVAILLMAMWPSEARFGAPESTVAQDSDPFNSLSEGSGSDSPFDDKPASNSKVVVGGDGVEQIIPSDTMSSTTQRDLFTERVLEKPVSLEYHETPFSEILEELAGTTKLNFLIHTSAQDDGLNEDEPITVNLNDIPLAKGLEMMLAPKNATYSIDHGVVVFISRDDADTPEFQRIKMFDCQELVNELPETASPGVGRLEGGGGQLEGGQGGGFFSIPPMEPQGMQYPQQTRQPTGNTDASILAKARELLAEHKRILRSQKVEKSSDLTLLKIVFDMVNPDSWEDNGGFAQAEVVNGILIVRQTEESLREIDGMIKDLRGNILKQ